MWFLKFIPGMHKRVLQEVLKPHRQENQIKTSANKMSRNLVAATVIGLLAGVSMAQGSSDTEGQSARLRCDKPIAKVMVGKLSCKASSCMNASAGSANPLMALLAAAGQPNALGIGDGIKDMLTTALQETGCFEVMDRDSMDEIKRELEAAGKKIETEAADFVITGSVNQVEMEKSSTSIGWGMIPVIGSLGKTTQKASIAMDLRLVSVSSGKVVGSKRIDANTEDSSFGIGRIGFGTGSSGLIGFGGAFSSLMGTSLEKVTRDAVFKATDFLVNEAKVAKRAGV